MAGHRMFSNRVGNSARFLQMPEGSQLLFFHMVLRADDDGVVETYPIMKLLGSAPDSLKVLYAKGFIKQLNEDQVAIIVDWKEHNKIRADRKVNSIYTHLIEEKCPELELLEQKERADRGNKNTGIKGRPSEESKRDGQRTDKGRHKLSQVKLSKVKLSAKADDPTLNLNMDLQEFIEWCKKSPQRHINIIADYADEKKVAFETKEQWQEFIKRNLRPARSLSPYSDEQIGEAMTKLNKAKKEYLTDWTLETLNKFLDK